MSAESSPEAVAAENRRLREAFARTTSDFVALEARLLNSEAIRRDLERQIALLKRCVFGSRSEKVSVEELEARIAEHAREAREQITQSKRPDQPPPEAEEEQPEEPEAGAQESGAGPTPKGAKRKARPHGRAPLPEHLPRRRIEHPIDRAHTTCPHCAEHSPLVKIGEDVREKLHKLPV